MLLASSLFAISQGSACEGPEECHWCGGPADKTWRHDDPPPMAFVKTRTLARRPASAYVCTGCWLWRRGRVTIQFLDEKSYKDGQKAEDWGWWITDAGAWAVREADRGLLYAKLLHPPVRFALGLIRAGTCNHLQLVEANEQPVIKADTRLRFSLDGTPLHYSVYELSQGILHGPDGKEPGVRALLDYLGECPEKCRPRDEQKDSQGIRGGEMGRDSRLTKKVVAASGQG